MTDQAEGFCTDLFAIRVRLCQAGEIPAMAMLVPECNGFKLWRRMQPRYEPENKQKLFAWLRALSNPTFPTKESLWQRGLDEWEADFFFEIAKFEREYKKMSDSDLKLAILSEVAPKALAPQIAMNSMSLSTYRTLREFIVQYLKSKNLVATQCRHNFRFCVCLIGPVLWASSHGDRSGRSCRRQSHRQKC